MDELVARTCPACKQPLFPNGRPAGSHRVQIASPDGWRYVSAHPNGTCGPALMRAREEAAAWKALVDPSTCEIEQGPRGERLGSGLWTLFGGLGLIGLAVIAAIAGERSGMVVLAWGPALLGVLLVPSGFARAVMAFTRPVDPNAVARSGEP